MTDPAPLLINDIVGQWHAARGHLDRVLARHRGAPLALFGAGDTAHAMLALTRSQGFTLAGVFDDERRGCFQGLTIRPREAIPAGAVVLVCCSRPEEELNGLFQSLRARGHTVLSCSPRRGPALQDLVGRHEGETAFVVGNGPSLNRTPLELLQGRLVLGCNRIYMGLSRLGLQLSYWTIEDPLVAEDTASEWVQFEGALKLVPEDLLWLVPDVEQVCPVPFRREPFEPDLPRFGRSASGLYWGGTVSYLMLQLAVLMGCRRIVLLGVDFSYTRPDHVQELDRPERWQSHGPDPNHFDPEYYGAGRKWHDPRLDRMNLGYRSARRHAVAAGVEVVNATPDSQLEVFPKVDLQACL